MASRIPTSLFALALVVSLAGLLVACSDRRPVSSDLGPGLAADLAPDRPTFAPDLRPPGLDLAPDLCVPTGRYPLKVVFLVDTSGSMEFTDPSNKAMDAVQHCLATCKQIGGLDCEALCKHDGLPGRQAAVQQVIEHLKNHYADVTLSIIAFNAKIQVSGGKSEQLLAPGAAGLSDALLMLQGAELSTDYQSALSAAKRVIEQDALAEDVATRGRSKYVIVLLSDGMPSPRCHPGCGNDTIEVGVTIDSWCDVERAQWCKHFNIAAPNCDMPSWYPAMSSPCLVYNSEVQLLHLVDEIALLETTHGVGEIRLHTALVFDSTLPKAIRDLFYAPASTPKQQSAEVEHLLENLAKAGRGVYWRFDRGQSIDFLDAQHPQVFTPLDPCAPTP